MGLLSIIKEKITRSKEAKNAIWLIVGRVAQMILSFFVGVLTARYLGPSNYGTLNYAAAFIAFFSSLCTLGINSVIIKNFSDHPDEEGTTIGTTLILRFVSSLLSGFMIIIIVLFLDAGEKETTIVVALSCLALLFQIADTFNYWFQIRYQSKVSSIATLAAYICTSTYKIILLVTHKSVVWFAFASSVDYICIALFLIVSYKKYNGPKLKISKIKAKELLSKSYNYILSGMMVAVYGQTDKLMLKQMLDEASVGYYSLASNINNLWVFVLAAIITSMTPTIIKYASTDKLNFEKKNRQLYMIIIYLSAFVAIGFTFFGEFIIKLLYGEQFLPAAAPLKIVCWYTAFSYLGVAREAWVISTDNQKYLKYIYAGAAIANVFLNWLLIPSFGAVGAALASLLAQVSTIIFIPMLIKEMRPNIKLMVEALIFRKVK